MARPAVAPVAVPAPSVMSRFRQRLFQPMTVSKLAASNLPTPLPRKQLGFQASLAEFLLVTRLRSRRRAAPSVEVLERASRVVFVTCQNWFAPADRNGTGHRTRI